MLYIYRTFDFMNNNIWDFDGNANERNFRNDATICDKKQTKNEKKSVTL